MLCSMIGIFPTNLERSLLERMMLPFLMNVPPSLRAGEWGEYRNGMSVGRWRLFIDPIRGSWGARKLEEWVHRLDTMWPLVRT